MSVSCTVIPTGLSGSLTTNGGRRGGSVSVSYRIKGADFDAMPLTVYQQATAATPDPLPQRWDPYNVKEESDTALFARNITLNHIPENGAPTGIWNASVHFGELDAGMTPAHTVQSAFDRPPVVWIEFERHTEVLDQAVLVGIRDSAGALIAGGIPHPTAGFQKSAGDVMPVLNAAMGPIEDGLQEEVTTVILAREDAYLSVGDVMKRELTWGRTLNMEPIVLGPATYPQMHAKFLGMSQPSQVNEGNSSYFTAVTRIAFSRRPFTRDVVNQGFTFHHFVDGVLNPGGIQGQAETAEPVNLNDDGTRITQEDVGTTGNYVSYRTRDLVDYAPLLAGVV